MADTGDIDLYADVDADFGTCVADTGSGRYVCIQQPPLVLLCYPILKCCL